MFPGTLQICKCMNSCCVQNSVAVHQQLLCMVIRTVNTLTQRVGNGAWSFEGLQRTDTDGNNTMVQCSSTHLTSFAILVNVGGPMTHPITCSNFLDPYGVYICILLRCSILHSKIWSVSKDLAPSHLEIFAIHNNCKITSF